MSELATVLEAPLVPRGISAEGVLTLGGYAFEGIVQAGLDSTFLDTEPAPVEQVPFGQFTVGDEPEDGRRAALATSTGHTGNNAEESA